MYRFYENTYNELICLVQWTRINGIQEMHDTNVNYTDFIHSDLIYLHTSDNSFFKIVTGFMLTVRCQNIEEKPCLKTFYSIEEPVVYT